MTQMSARQVTDISASGQFRIASVNLHFAGVARGGDDSCWQASMAALRAWDPDIVLLQEMAAPAGVIAGLHAHLWRTANELDMTPLLGPPGPLSVTGNHPAVLVKTSRGLTILDAGPPLWASGGGPAPAWCQALVQVPGIPHPIMVYQSSRARIASAASRPVSFSARCKMVTSASRDGAQPGLPGSRTRPRSPHQPATDPAGPGPPPPAAAHSSGHRTSP
jgi:hypothetical protein